VKEASDRYLRDLASRWESSEGVPRREAVEILFREVLVGLGPFTRQEMDVFCRGVSVAALATVMASLGRRFEEPDEVLTFVQLLACRAALEAENARRA
jgi:hypothetical protein